MKQTLILGNIITMDEKRPTAKAALVKDGVFAYIGTAEEARELAGKDAAVLDYGENFVYPGFLESHAHPYLAGDRAVGMAILNDAYWNKGYGTMALEGWLLYLLEHGCQELYLQTWSGNGRMIHVAEKLGFTECERCVGFHEWQGRQYDALTFRLDVEAFRAILKKETEDTD